MDDMLQFRPEEQTQAQLTSLQAANGDAEMLSPRAASPALQHVSDTSPEEVSPLPKAPPPQNAHETRDSPKPRDVTASAACLTCRSRHLKCDGQNPCGRCQLSASKCVYVASRRGRKRRPRCPILDGANASIPSTSDAGHTPSCSATLGFSYQEGQPSDLMRAPGRLHEHPANFHNDRLDDISLPEPTQAGTPSGAFSDTGKDDFSGDALEFFDPFAPFGRLQQLDLDSYNRQAVNSSDLARQDGVPATVETDCHEAFYYYLFAAHPFMLPRDCLHLIEQSLLEPLLATMKWTGSLFLKMSVAVQDELLRQAFRSVYSKSASQDGFLVQAMVLFCVVLDGSGRREDARRVLSDAKKLALAIGLNKKDFARNHGRGLLVLEESWRRTWWDLFTVDALMAAVHQTTEFTLFDETYDVQLPCEEEEYLSGQIPFPVPLDELDVEGLIEEPAHKLSSFAHRIACSTHLGKLMRMPRSFEPGDDRILQLRCLLTNWQLHLPESKRDSLREDGGPDEMMFQAHLINHMACILLHRPHSQLDSSVVQSVDYCSPQRALPTVDLFNSHTQHTTTAARGISNAITNSQSLLSHTHFFVCIIILSSTVHLSRWALTPASQEDSDLKNMIRLNTGALGRLSPVWDVAGGARAQVQKVAREIHRIKKQEQLNKQVETAFLQDDVLGNMGSDDLMNRQIQDF